MRQQVLLDTGPLVALVNRRDRFHQWVKTEWEQIEPPLLTCEAVITEASFLLSSVYGGQKAVMSLIERGVVQIPFRLEEEVELVGELLDRYQSIPMSLADACMVRMAERYTSSYVLTIDSDFNIYRKQRNQLIPVIMPSNDR
ncbi:type II toxin-antitoxin system VapC family toxin [Chroococcidiopsis thermalis]|uniref:PilT protein domain protein n=1 Tax=Chroococcidiopsis thermalis (strain PCC 7203) TaxID=251229 RepID=K9U307_CHRTP|nr:PIN domain-containing protein [Chroococcidiopsis thermalis]AFY89205.1 PilT protein domain protein [Chroococcidiopsis thermalis PCC 7203]PSB44446.1 PIN domain-containing protein [Cyanosarcina cf. burmensis CCALA 770]